MAAASVKELIGQNEQAETACDPQINQKKKQKKNNVAVTDVEDSIEQNEQLEIVCDSPMNPQKKKEQEEEDMQLSDLIETFRSISESEKHWECRRDFIFRNYDDYEDPHVDQLLALSMVWANHVFLGCRYDEVLLEKVKEMAEGIVVEDAPVFKTRDELIKQKR
ncbi:CDKN2AIP N-terminal-like protein [Puntigrus tetrazona]|uniref:CDKN2AIP N-terminal-like protein n=1 Tax=Puntigrus tetrazona TaxID=1606681 RepID=UPI001C8AAF9C|nr:CDKN2AIP N-terminal-like protein [Puntigrus tetrazona]